MGIAILFKTHALSANYLIRFRNSLVSDVVLRYVNQTDASRVLGTTTHTICIRQANGYQFQEEGINIRFIAGGFPEYIFPFSLSLFILIPFPLVLGFTILHSFLLVFFIFIFGYSVSFCLFHPVTLPRIASCSGFSFSLQTCTAFSFSLINFLFHCFACRFSFQISPFQIFSFLLL